VHRLYLSRTNLKTLLDKLDRGCSQAAIMKNDINHPTHPTTVPTLLIAIEDQLYYASRGRDALNEIEETTWKSHSQDK
jgi:hypothetical protein